MDRRFRVHGLLDLLMIRSLLPKSKHILITNGLANAYDPKIVEAEWYEWWSQHDLFNYKVETSKISKHMILPPPNVTGSLHIGHALTNTIQDVFVRYNRMCGHHIQWIPGLDHAGIATQTVVEQQLLKQGVKRREIGRQAFETHVWKWKDKYGDRINEQQRKLGSSLDWNDEYFTLDRTRTAAVNEAFVRLYEMNLIERGSRMVNWDCYLGTTISDIEVDTIDIEPHTFLTLPARETPVEFGVLHQFAYKVDDDDGNDIPMEVIVSTTRIETMFGDVAVAVHSNDERYKHLRNRLLIQPITGRRVPIIYDDVLVDPTVGSGAVKVTPAHDTNDYECGIRHQLPIVNILNNDGVLCDTSYIPKEFRGIDRFNVRPLIINALKECDAYRGHCGHKMRLAICSRSGDVLEPMIKPQWFVNMKNMCMDAIKSVNSGELSLLPRQSGYKYIWNKFLSNTNDWCISRQLWWGHRIPAYYMNETETWIVARSIDDAYKKARELYPNIKEFELIQDEDVLDTWFSSALLPLSCYKWPDTHHNDIPSLTLMETGGDILFFWVARMYMLCKTLNNQQEPFKHVYLHPLICDSQGKKMSKSRGNVVDPMDVIYGQSVSNLLSRLHDGNLPSNEIARVSTLITTEYSNGIPECGTDALRFTLCNYIRGGRIINFDIKRVHHYRLFCNKMYQACRYVLMHHHHHHDNNNYNMDDDSIINQWIRSRIAKCIMDCEDAYNEYDVANVTDLLYNFFQHEFCDDYVEYTKILLQHDDEMVVNTTKRTLYMMMEMSLRLFHPFMPFLTEELWQTLSSSSSVSIMISRYPCRNDVISWYKPHIEESFAHVRKTIDRIRSMKSQYANIIDNKRLILSGSYAHEIVNAYGDILQKFLKINEICTHDTYHNDRIVYESVLDNNNNVLSVGFHIVNTTALISSIKTMKKRLLKLEAKHSKQLNAMNVPSYETRVPLDIRQKHSESLQRTHNDMKVLQASITTFNKLLI